MAAPTDFTATGTTAQSVKTCKMSSVSLISQPGLEEKLILNGSLVYKLGALSLKDVVVYQAGRL